MSNTSKHIVFIGANGLTGSDFIARYGGKHHVTAITRQHSMADLPPSADVVVFAAQSGDYKKPEFTADLFAVNVQLVQQVLQHYAGKATHFIYFSTGSVYQPQATPLTEASPLNIGSGNPYVASKIMGEELVATYKNAFEHCTVLRPFFIYGRKQSGQMLMKAMFERVRTGQKITLSGERGLIFNPVHVQDMSDALNHLITSTTEKGIAYYNVGGPEIGDLHQAVRKMAQWSDQPLDITIQGSNDTTLLATVNIPGWTPVVHIEEGLTLTFGDEK